MHIKIAFKFRPDQNTQASANKMQFHTQKCNISKKLLNGFKIK